MTLYAYCGLEDKARLVMRDMVAAGLELRTEALLKLLEIFGDLGSPPNSIAVLVEARQLGLRRLEPLWDQLLLICARAGDVKLMHALIDDMLSDECAPGIDWLEQLQVLWLSDEKYPLLRSTWVVLTQHPNSHRLPPELWKSMARTARKRKDYPLLIELVDKMKALGISMRPLDYLELMRFHATRSGDLRKLRDMWKCFRTQGGQDFYLFGADLGSVLHACTDVALSSGIYQPSPEALSAIEFGTEFFEFESAHPQFKDKYSMHEWMAVLYALIGNSQAAAELLEEQANANALTRYFSIGCLGLAIAAAKESRWHDIIDVFYKYIAPNKQRFGSALFSFFASATARVGSADAALAIWQYTLTQTDHCPRAEAYANILIAFAQDGRLLDMVRLMEHACSHKLFAIHVTEYLVHVASETLSWYRVRTPRLFKSMWIVPPSSPWKRVSAEADKLNEQLSPDQVAWVIQAAIPSWKHQITSESVLQTLEACRADVRARLAQAGFQNSELIRQTNAFRRVELQDTLAELAGSVDTTPDAS
jgi:hypothetical protein